MADTVGDHAAGPAPFSMVYTTYPDIDAARACAREMVEEKLAACVNIIPNVVSIYRWDGAVSEDGEVIALFKTRRERVAELMEAVRVRHGYATPALAVYDMAAGSPDFLAWIASATGPD